jgi:penicillin-binding protein 2
MDQIKEHQEIVELDAIKIDNQKHWEEVISAMQNVMQGNGTARNVGKDAPYRMAGKSGTVQVISVGQEEEYDEENIEEKFRDHALFVSFAPIESPKIAVSVIIENGQSGSQVAAPIAKAIMDKHLGY